MGDESGKAPAFQFYPKDFLTDERVALMSNTETGIYIRLLCFCWLEGSLPLETDLLARMARMPVPQFTRLWEQSPLRQCFQLSDDGRLRHKRLEAERAKQQDYRENQSESGKRGAAKRWGRHSAAMPSPSSTDRVAISSPMAKNSSPISDLRSPDSCHGERRPPRSSAKGPLPGFPRLRLFEWQAQQLTQSLGEAEFDLEGWLLGMEQNPKLLFPTDDQDRWKWVKSALDFELRRLGILAAGPQTDEARLNALASQGPSRRPYEAAK